jgi:hypothetical protein
MVSLAKVIIPLAFASGALAKNFYVAAASNVIVRILTSARQPNIDAAKASSEAGRALDAFLTYPPIDGMISRALELKNVPDMAQAERMVHEASSILNQFQHEAFYPSYAKFVREHAADFNVKKIIQVATSSVKRYLPLLGRPENVGKAFNDPRVKEMINTFGGIGNKFVKDFGLARFYTDLPTHW